MTRALLAWRQIAAAARLSEIGVEMSRFPSAKQLACWAGVCPGTTQSGGKRLSGKTTTGTARLRSVLIAVVWNSSRMKHTELSAQSHRLARRLGKLKAAMALAHSLPIISYHVLSDKHPSRDWGVDYFDKLDKERLTRQALRRLEALGSAVTLTPKQQQEA